MNVKRELVESGENLPCREDDILYTDEVESRLGGYMHRQLVVWYIERDEQI